MEKQIIKNVSDWEIVANDLLTQVTPINGATVFALSGDLGAGKTTFVQALANALGVAEQITSPTFNIFKKYETNHDFLKTLVHMDAYRLESEDELVPLRFADILATPNTLVCIEWAEKIAAALPVETQRFLLEINSHNQHTIQSLS